MIEKLCADAPIARVFGDARAANAQFGDDDAREMLQEVRSNLLDNTGAPRLSWGTGALASSGEAGCGREKEIRFTLGWYFPHHLSADGQEMGHMYANWYKDAGEVNRFLCADIREHRAATEAFARTLADTPAATRWPSRGRASSPP